jgi:hypothetical protein
MGFWIQGLIGTAQMIPSSLKFSMEGATPSFADNEGQTVEAGSQVRLRIKGIRSELNQMYAIGSIREDYLGYEATTRHEQIALGTDRRLVLLCSSELRATAASSIASLMLGIGRERLLFMFVTAVYHNLDFSEALEKLVRVEKNKGEDKYVYVSCQSRYPVGTHSLMSKDFLNVASQCARHGLRVCELQRLESFCCTSLTEIDVFRYQM